MKKALCAVLLSGILATAQAEIIPFTVSLDGPQAGNASPATGSDLFIEYDTTSQILSLVVGYGSGTGGVDLTGDFTAAHIHRSVGTVFEGLTNVPFPAGSAVSGLLLGTIDYSASPAEEIELLGGLQYVNVHSTIFNGGEIRGNLTPVPEPTTLALLGLGVSGLLVLRRRT